MKKRVLKITWATALLLVGLVVLLNFLTVLIVNLINLPLFLDTWGTMFGVAVGGLVIGTVGGIIYNLIMSATIWGTESWVWLFSNVWVALSVFFLYKQGFLDLKKPLKVLFAGLVIGFTNSLITFQISYFVFQNLPTYEPIAFINNFFSTATGSRVFGSFMEHVSVEIVDKIIALFLALSVAKILPVKFVHYCKKDLVKKAKPTKA